MTSANPPKFEFTAEPELSQERSRRALERFLVAGEELLAKNAFEEASVAEIAKLASSSVGSFYRILGDKESLLLLLLQEFFNGVTEQISAHPDLAASSLNQSVEHLVGVLVNAYTGRRGVLRALILRASKSTDFRDQVHELNSFVSTTAVKVTKPFFAEVKHDKPRQAVSRVFHMALGALNQHTITGSLGKISSAALKAEISTMILAYLKHPK